VRLPDADGNELTEEAHKDCPGHAAYVSVSHDQWACECIFTDPQTHGHKPRCGKLPGGNSADPAESDEEAREERREVRARNAEWQAATQVCRDFLKELPARKKARDDALRVIIDALAEGGNALRRQMECGHKASHPHAHPRRCDGAARV